MSMSFRWILTLVVTLCGLQLTGQVAPVDADSELVRNRKEVVKEWCTRELSGFREGIDKLFIEREHDATCRTRMLLLETALDCPVRPEVRDWVHSEARVHWKCLEPNQQFYFTSDRGQKFYGDGRLDSALFYTQMATDLALANADTTRYFLSLSNLSFLFTEIRWYPEALSTSLWAYDLSVTSGDTASVYFAYAINNLVSSHLDMGHVELASQLTPKYHRAVQNFGNDELRQLEFINSFRIQCMMNPERALDIWNNELRKKDLVLRGKLANYVANELKTLSPSARDALKKELVGLMESEELSSEIKLNFVVPALVDFVEFPVSVRKELLELELDVLSTTNVFVRRDFYEVMAKVLESSEYWGKYRTSVHEVDSASTLYAVVYSGILKSISQEALMEHQKSTYGSQLIRRGKFMLIAALGAALVLMFGLFRVLHLRKKAVEAINVLRDSQEQLKETEVRYAILRDQVQGLANQRSPSIKKSSIVEILELHSANEVAEWEQLRDWMDRFGLTRTEAEVLARIAVGWSNPDLVVELNLAKSYIHNVRGQLRKKLRIPKNLTLEEAAQRIIKD